MSEPFLIIRRTERDTMKNVYWLIMKITNKMAKSHKPRSSVSTHPRHQPAATWVNTTRYCKYSQVLLIMDENIARNM